MSDKNDLLREIYRWLARAQFSRTEDENKACTFGARLRDVIVREQEQKVDDVVRDARLGNRLYVWDYENPEDGSWDNIEEYLNDTTPNAGETVRLNLALPLQDVEVEMLEVGGSGEPIRWVVRDAKTGALLAAQQQKEGE